MDRKSVFAPDSKTSLPTALEERRAWDLALRGAEVIEAQLATGQTTGAVLRAGASPVRDAWLDALKGAVAPRPIIKLPNSISEERLLGGVDLSATLSSGQLVEQLGLLDQARREAAVLLVPMAEGLPHFVAHHLARLLDESDNNIAVVLFDESDPSENVNGISQALSDRLPLHIDLNRLSWRVTLLSERQRRDERWAATSVEDPARQLSIAALQFGLASVRPAQQALRVYRALENDFAATIELSLLGRALVIPAPPDQTEADDQPAPPPPPPPQAQEADNDNEPPPETDREDCEQSLDDIPDELVLDAVLAALPDGLLAEIAARNSVKRTAGEAGRTGASQKSKQRGRPIGSRPGELRASERLHLTDTLRAALPYQKLRPKRPNQKGRVSVRKSDFRLRRFKDQRESLTLFTVDASGSTAVNRLAEAKGAIELLLAESYSRRDSVALIAFRGDGAELILPPTRALTRAKRLLGGLPGGGPTPLAAGLQLSDLTADLAVKKGQSVTCVLITDGSGNIALDGSAGRAQANEDAQAVAARIGRKNMSKNIVIDVAKRPSKNAQDLAESMNAHYLPLPRVDAASLTDSVKALG